MSLRFIFGPAGTGKTVRCCEEIRKYVTGEKERSAFLLVPDQETYTAERMLAGIFPGKGFMNVTVCGFSRLAYRVFQELRSPVRDALSPLGQQLVVSHILNDHKNELQILAKSASQPHFADRLVQLFHQLDMFCVSETDLATASLQEENTPLGKKLSDLALLYKNYHSFLRERFSYEGSLFDLLAREIPRSDMLRRSRIWIDGFNGMAPQKINIVSALVQTAEQVTFTLQMPDPNTETGCEIFAQPDRLYRMLLQTIGQAESVTLSEYHRYHCPRILSLVSGYFQSPSENCPLPKAQPVTPEKGVHLVAAPDRNGEADFMARRMLTLVRDKGLRWRDILVLLRTGDHYTDALERSFLKYKIPGFIDKKQPVNNHPLVILIDSLIRFLSAESKGNHRGFQRNIIFRLLKTNMLSSFSRDEVDRLENYTMKYNIRYGLWQKPWTFRDYGSPDGEPGALTQKEAEIQKEANVWREKTVTLLNPLRNCWKMTATAKEKCTVLYEWLIEQKIPRTLAARDDEEYEKTKSRPHSQVWKKIISLFEEAVHASGNESMSDDTFFLMLKDGLSSLTYSMIPPTLDHVTVTSMDRGYAAEAKVVFIPGLLEGEFPQKIDDSGFFTESEKQLLWSHAKINLGDNLLQLIGQEQFYAYLALTRSSDALYLSYPESGDDGSRGEASFLFTQLKDRGYYTEYIHALSPSPAEDDPSFFANPDQSLSLLPLILHEGIPPENSRWTALRNWAKKENPALLQNKLAGLYYQNTAASLSKEEAKKLFMPKGRFFGSVTKLQNYRTCPYRYFLQYGLGIEERKTGDVDALDYGNYLHASLHQFGARLKKEHRQWRDADDDNIKNMSKEITEELIPRIKSGALHSDMSLQYTKRVLDRTFEDALKRFRQWSRQSGFDTIDLERPFTVRISAGPHDSFTLIGKIDRIDSDGKHVVVSDYKTGRPTVSLNDILNGTSLQLITYLLALSKDKEMKNLLPAAMMYIYLHGSVRPVETVPPDGIPPLKEKDGVNGLFLDDSAVLETLDKEAGHNNSFLPVRYTLKGAVHSASPILSESQFESLKIITEEILIRLYQEMQSGDISIYPVKSGTTAACSYCPYRSICRFEPQLEENNFNYLVKDKNAKHILEEKAADLVSERKEIPHE